MLLKRDEECKASSSSARRRETTTHSMSLRSGKEGEKKHWVHSGSSNSSGLTILAFFLSGDEEVDEARLPP